MAAETFNLKQIIKGMILMHVSKGDPVKQFIFEAVVVQKIGEHL